MKVTALPAVGSFDDLQDLQKRVSDAIIIAVDFEAADHTYGDHSAMDNLSEGGLAYLDTRDLHHRLAEATPVELARAIKVEHMLVKKFAWVTAETCPARWHARKPHTAQPYHCQLARSVMMASNTQLMDGLVRRLGSFESMNIGSRREKGTGAAKGRSGARDALDKGEIELAERLKACSIQDQAEPQEEAEARDVFVLFWDSNLEERVFSGAGNSQCYLRPTFRFWDLQKFSPIANRWKYLHNKSQAGCSEVVETLGINGVKLHNGANDAYAEVLAFVRLLGMTEKEFDGWRRDRSYQLDPIDMSWLDGKILKDNQALGEREVERWKAGSGGRGRGGCGGRGGGGRGGAHGGSRGGHRGGRREGVPFTGW